MSNKLDNKNCKIKKANISIINPTIACVIICLALSISSLFPPDFKNLNAPSKKYSIIKKVAIDKIGGIRAVKTAPKDL